jgi:hypothetical protein
LFLLLFYFIIFYFVRWLFPTHEIGKNPHAQALNQHEIDEFRSSDILRNRLITSYELMLDFYGMKLDRDSGKVDRNQDNYQVRYKHLNTSTRSHQCITRILVCLGLLHLEHYKAPLLHHIINELRELLFSRTIEMALKQFWIPTLQIPKDLATMLMLIGE